MLVSSAVALAAWVALAGVVSAVSRRADQWALDLLAVEVVHADVDGSGIVVAVVDTGLSPGHDDLVGRVVAGWDFVEDTEIDPTDPARLISPISHGTMVAGIIGGDADDDGITGVAPGVSLMPVRVVPDSGQGTTTMLADGIRWAVDNGADVINVSIRTSTDSPRVRAAVEHASNSGVIVLASAGTSRSEGPWYPAALEDVIAVGAVNEDLSLYDGSPAADYVELVAPGGFIVSSAGAAVDAHAPGRGTSFAVPHVSGVVAIMRSVAPDATLSEIREALHQTARDLGPPGRDAEFGHGLIDPVGALMWVDRREPEAPVPLSFDVSDGVISVGIAPSRSFDVVRHELVANDLVLATANPDASTLSAPIGTANSRPVVVVRAVDAAGRVSGASLVANPTAVETIGGRRTITLQWDAPDDANVTAFEIWRDGEPFSSVVRGAAVRHTFTVDVEPGVRTTLGVASVGPVNIRGPVIDGPIMTAQADVPPPVVSLVATPRPRAVDLSWDLSSSVSAIVVRRDGVVVDRLPGRARSMSVTGLEPGVAHTFSVQTAGRDGNGPVVFVAAAATVDPPGRPENVEALSQPGRVVVTWTPATGAVSAHSIRRDGAEVARTAGDVSFWVDTGADAGVRHDYTIVPLGPGGTGVESTIATGAALDAPVRSGGWWMAGSRGTVLAVGQVEAMAGAGRRIAAVALNPAGDGYWSVSVAGRVSAHAGAPWLGDVAHLDLNAPIVAMEASPDGRGYWLLGADGGVFALGGARFHGSTGAMALDQPAVDLVASPTGRGYLLAAADGGVFAFGDAAFRGSAGAIELEHEIVSIDVGPRGYVLAGADGGVFAFAERFHGSLPGLESQPRGVVTDIAVRTDGLGYLMLLDTGEVVPFGTSESVGRTRFARGERGLELMIVH